MGNPLFSCVVPVKGERPFFDEAMASLCSQGLNYEVIDHHCQPRPLTSTSELEIIIQDADVEPDAGQSDAFNRGFAKARGEWLFWLNADDVLLPGALQKVKAIILSSTSTSNFDSCNWIVGNEIFIDGNGNRIGCSIGNGWHDWLYRHAVPHVHGPSAFFRKDLLERVGGIDAALRFCMDWDLWIRFMRAGARFVRINDFLWAQRRWAGSKTQRDMPADELESQWKEIRAMLKKNDFTLTCGGVWLTRAWRAVSGCYLREAIRGW